MKKNKEWLKEELTKQIDILHTTISSGNYVNLVKRAEIMGLIDQLYEPEQEKVVVNEIMAGHIENCKNLKLALSDSLHLVVPGDKQEEVLFARAWIDGYAVEKEKLYYVRENNYLLCKYNDEVIDYVEAVECEITNLVNLKLTEKEIKDYDERYWTFAEEVPNE